MSLSVTDPQLEVDVHQLAELMHRPVADALRQAVSDALARVHAQSEEKSKMELVGRWNADAEDSLRTAKLAKDRLEPRDDPNYVEDVRAIVRKIRLSMGPEPLSTDDLYDDHGLPR